MGFAALNPSYDNAPTSRQRGWIERSETHHFPGKVSTQAVSPDPRCPSPPRPIPDRRHSRASGAARTPSAARRTPVISPHFRAFARSLLCAAAIINCPGSMSSSFAAPRYVSGSGLKCPNRSEPKIMSHGMPAFFAHVEQQRHVAVGQRPDDELPLQPRQPGHRIRPRLQPVPAAVDMLQIGLGQPLDAELRHQHVERGAMQPVQRRPRLLALAHAVHRRVIGRAPGIHQRGPVGVDVALAAERGQLGDQAAAPVHHGAERIEYDCDRLFARHCVLL